MLTPTSHFLGNELVKTFVLYLDKHGIRNYDGNSLRNALLSFIHFSLYGKASKDYKLITLLLSDLVLSP